MMNIICKCSRAARTPSKTSPHDAVQGRRPCWLSIPVPMTIMRPRRWRHRHRSFTFSNEIAVTSLIQIDTPSLVADVAHECLSVCQPVCQPVNLRAGSTEVKPRANRSNKGGQHRACYVQEAGNMNRRAVLCRLTNKTLWSAAAVSLLQITIPDVGLEPENGRVQAGHGKPIFEPSDW